MLIKPIKINPIFAKMFSIRQMENIGNFLKGCSAIGVPSSDMFQTVDLYEGQNMVQVNCTIL